MLVAGFVLSTTGPAYAGTLDQQQSQTNHVAPTYGCFTIFGSTYCFDSSWAQTFTAGLSGPLDRVDLLLAREGTPTPLMVEIRTVTSGCPSDTVLASTQLPSADVPPATGSPPAFTPITFSSPANVVTGTQYAVVFYTTPGNAYDVFYDEVYFPPNPYSGGRMCTSASPPATWGAGSPGSYDDLAFKTYVVAPPAPPGANTGQRTAAVKQCTKQARKHGWPKKRLKRCKRKAKKLPL